MALSKNKQLHEYGETKAEFLIHLLGVISESPDDEESQRKAMDKAMKEAKNKHSTYTDLLTTKPILEMLLRCYNMREYFVTTSIFKPFELRKHFKVYGGVSVVLILVNNINNN